MHIDPTLSHVLLHEQENQSQRSITTGPTSHALITPPPGPDDLTRIEQQKRIAPQDIVQFQGIEIDLDQLDAINNTDDNTVDVTFDIRTMTPREMADFSLDLYIDGSLSFEEYSMLAFQPELHPGFENTIGALTGERADPDRPRDYIQQWQDRFDFEKRYPSGDPKKLEQIDRILGVLHGFEETLDFVA
ncbi:hypothetical protein GCM10011332_12500 [Terasakiella brassicae]|uniref:Uncharacterized protein n=1 Tax=Terasakiella brassicae TaxID=1634917 RepID=A0A917BXB9_9PROT|nr:hypothetical protein [Terasakiella brassicae]GGF60303.1 hypothetical protein GCM10011332_12500 [Terasakiella brassicae]